METLLQFSQNRNEMRKALAALVIQAKQTIPECETRIDSAVKMVLAGDVELLPDGNANVASGSVPDLVYANVNGHCDCKDFPTAPHGNWCKHRIARAMMIRLMRELPPAAPAVAPLPEAPVSISIRGHRNGHEVTVTLRGSDVAMVQAQTDEALRWLDQNGNFGKISETSKSAEEDSPWCSKHDVALERQSKGEAVWFSHKIGSKWCKG